MELDIRRNVGYGTIITRRRSSILPYGWLLRLGYLSIPFFWAGKTLNSCQDCLRRAHDYQVRWYELPAALVFAVLVNLMEVPGMVAALRGRRITYSCFR